MAFSGGGGAMRSEINVTPLVDVVLVLLIIFMVLVPSLLKEVSVNVPERADVLVATPASADQVVVSVGRDGRITVNREPVSQSDVAGRIRSLLASRADKLVFFDIDDDARYGDAVHVMDLCRGAGARVIGLMTR